MKNEIILFENQSVKLEVNVKDEKIFTVYELFKLRCINNVFVGELEKRGCCKFCNNL